MAEEETIEQLRKENEQLRRENELLKAKVSELELLKARIIELESRLAKYENAHTPPSLRRGRNRGKRRNESDKGKPGQKVGNEGITRPHAKPDETVEVTADRCPDCGAKLGNPVSTESRIVEEIPEPQPSIVTEFLVAHYICPCCQKEVIATDPNCPHEGIFGNNTIAQVTMLKYQGGFRFSAIQFSFKFSR